MNMLQCYVVRILCTFFSVMDANIPQTQISVLSIMQFFTSLCYFCYLRSRYFPQSMFFNTLNPCFSPRWGDHIFHPCKAVGEITVLCTF